MVSRLPHWFGGLLLAGSGLLAAGLPLALLPEPSAAAQPADRKRTEANLKALTDRIERVQRQVQQDAVQKDRLNRDLREAERSVAKAQGGLSELRAQRAQRSATRARLVAERDAREADRRKTLDNLAEQLRAAYFLGQHESLKLLLNQRSPAQFNRNLTYYGYFGRQRADQIAHLNQNIAAIDELTAQIDTEDAELARLEGQQKQKVSELESARRERGRVLASLERESRNRVATLDRLQKQRAQLEQLLKELARAAEAVPFDPNAPFARLRGKLSWPVAGKVDVGFGETIAGGLRSNGIEIDADRGSNVRAVAEGRVVYADWLPGRGLLIILDHGNGYLSLYGHNEQLFKAAGARVQPGDVIATAGDSGGRKRPGLYFEVRRQGKPVDPKGWFAAGSPPRG